VTALKIRALTQESKRGERRRSRRRRRRIGWRSQMVVQYLDRMTD
jgi:hypothetical protein